MHDYTVTAQYDVRIGVQVRRPHVRLQLVRKVSQTKLLLSPFQPTPDLERLLWKWYSANFSDALMIQHDNNVDFTYTLGSNPSPTSASTLVLDNITLLNLFPVLSDLLAAEVS